MALLWYLLYFWGIVDTHGWGKREERGEWGNCVPRLFKKSQVLVVYVINMIRSLLIESYNFFLYIYNWMSDAQAQHVT